MKVKSTGLGKTQLTAHFDGFTAKEGGEPSAVLIITSTEPVHWHIECDLGGSDLRQFAGQVLRPSMIWHLIKLLVQGGDARGFVMEKEGGRRSGKERVSRTAKTPSTAAPESAATTAAPVTAPEPAAAPVAAAPATVAASPSGETLTSVRPARPAAVQNTAAAPTSGPAQQSVASESTDREDRERRRAERRRQREEAAEQYATAG